MRVLLLSDFEIIRSKEYLRGARAEQRSDSAIRSLLKPLKSTLLTHQRRQAIVIVIVKQANACFYNNSG